MSKRLFKSMRAITDKQLDGALRNHQQGLNNIGLWAVRTQSMLSWGQWWALGVTVWVIALTIYVVAK